MSAVKPTRKERAAETRRRMLDAALACFTEDGYPGTTMAAIAARAGVAVQTLYFTFHTKAGLLGQVFERAVHGEADLPPPMQPWYREALDASTIDDALASWATGVGEIAARTAPLRPVFDGFSGDDEVAALWARGEELRVEGYRALFQQLADRHGLAERTDLDVVVDTALVLIGPLGHRGFVTERGWTVDAWTSHGVGLLRPFFASS